MKASIRLVSISYPLLSMLWVAMAARFAFTPAVRLPAFRLLIAGVFLHPIAGFVYSWLMLNGTYSANHTVNAVWLLSYGLFGAAILHPPIRELSADTTGQEGGNSIPRLAALDVYRDFIPGSAAEPSHERVVHHIYATATLFIPASSVAGPLRNAKVISFVDRQYSKGKVSVDGPESTSVRIIKLVTRSRKNTSYSARDRSGENHGRAISHQPAWLFPSVTALITYDKFPDKI